MFFGHVHVHGFSLLGLNGLGKERAPQEDGAPKEKSEETKAFGKGEGELGQREGVGGDDGEEA